MKHLRGCGAVGYQHCVAVGVEAVFLFDGVLVGVEDVFEACEGCDQGEECGFWQVEICYDCVDDFEFVALLYEEVRCACGCFYS